MATDNEPAPERVGEINASKSYARPFLRAFAIIGLAVPLVIGVAWAGDGHRESWGSALIGVLFVVMVMMSSGSNGFWMGGD